MDTDIKTTPNPDNPLPSPAPDIAQPPAAEAAPTAPLPNPAPKPELPISPATDAKPAPPKPVNASPSANPGVGLAIVATLVIVLGLAALATYAYLKTR